MPNLTETLIKVCPNDCCSFPEYKSHFESEIPYCLTLTNVKVTYLT